MADEEQLVDLEAVEQAPVAQLIEGFREARLDGVIAQELHADPEFARWLWLRLVGDPEREVSSVEVELNVGQTGPEFPADAQGETDVLATIHWADGSSSVLLIEDKVGAPFQPRQAERYRQRADALGGRAILIAPKEYPVSATNSALFDGVVRVEEIADWLDGRSTHSSWNAKLLRSLVASIAGPAASDELTVQFTEHCIRWFEQRGSGITPDPKSLHTKKQGWLYFRDPAALIYKTVGVNAHDHAMVDLYLDRHGLDVEVVRQRLEAVPCTVVSGSRSGSAFVTQDSGGKHVLRVWVDKITPSAGVPTGTLAEALEFALCACVRLTGWSASCTDDSSDDLDLAEIRQRTLGRVSAVFDRPVMQNNFRSLFAEHLVGELIGPSWTHVGDDWLSWDFERSGVRLEVKQSAARQSWKSNGPSKPAFDIAPREGYWDGAVYVSKLARHSHIYVFSWQPETDESVDHRRPDQWEFYVVPTGALPDQKTIGLPGLRSLSGFEPVTWGQLSRVVRECADQVEVGE
jgi:hypothetical protein